MNSRLSSLIALLIALGGRATAQDALALTDGASSIGARGLVYEGRPVFLAGSGAFWLLNDPHYYNLDGTTHLANLRAHLDAYKPADLTGKALGVVRVSAFGTPVRYSGVDHSLKRYPCARTSTPGANDGGNKFDCSQFDDQFFAHTLTVIREAHARGMVIGIILWDEIPLEGNTYRWNHNPFCPDNNVNGYGLPACGSNAVPEFYTTSPGPLRDHQDAIVGKFVDELQAEPNVFLFISNEYTGSDAWRDRQIQTIDDRNTQLGVDLLHVTMSYSGGPSAVSDGVSCSTHSTCTGSEAFRADGRPAVNQRDRSGASNVRAEAWRRFIDGCASAGTRDDYSGATDPTTVFDAAAEADERLRVFVDALASPLDQLAPDDTVASAGWEGRSNPGAEYVFYRDDATGTISVDLTSETGTWRLLDWDPASTAPPDDRGIQPAGAAATWTVRSGECGARVFPDGGPDSVPPAAPQDLQVDSP